MLLERTRGLAAAATLARMAAAAGGCGRRARRRLERAANSKAVTDTYHGVQVSDP